MIKKGFNVFLALILLVVSFMCPVYRVEAKSIGDMKKELQAKEEAYEKAKQQKELTEKEREEIQASIKANEDKLVELLQENEKLTDEIAELNKSIEEKYEEIKRIINSNQLMDSTASYLEYIFGASTFTDFICRASVAEQLSKYNKDLTDQMERDIKAREEKQAAIAKKQDEIATLQEKLSNQYAKLGEKLSALTEEMDNEQDNIKLLKNNISELQNTYKCSDDEDIEACKERARRSNYIPPSTGAFKRPINYAIVTANYGYYAPFGYRQWHAAMDLAGDPGAKIYAAAPGRVVDVHTASCGNHIVYIVHNINGTRYTTGYWHMRTAYVKVGDLVGYDTVIGIQGGARWEDSCSTGQHLDFVLTLGAYKTDYFGNPRSISVNPRNYLSFPELIESYPGSGMGRSAEWTTR